MIPPEGIKEFSLTTESGNQIHTWYQEVSPNAPVVIHFHGNSYNIGAAYKGGLFARMKEEGLNFVMWDYPSYGLSTGKPSEFSLTEASIEVMNKIESIFPNQKKILWGRSLGTGIATKTAHLFQDSVHALILTSPWDYAYRLVMSFTGFGKKTSQKTAKGNQYRSADYAKEIHIPTLIFHGNLDNIVEYKLGQSLYNHFPKGVASFITKEGKAHNDLQDKEYWDDFFTFIESL